MERFGRAAEAKKRRQTEQEVKIVVQETAEIFAGIESPKRVAQTS
jgi:hypothetical protein